MIFCFSLFSFLSTFFFPGPSRPVPHDPFDPPISHHYPCNPPLVHARLFSLPFFFSFVFLGVFSLHPPCFLVARENCGLCWPTPRPFAEGECAGLYLSDSLLILGPRIFRSCPLALQSFHLSSYELGPKDLPLTSR